MTALEAIPKISELLVLLIKRVKDRETGALVQQIQQHQLVIHKELMQAQARIAELEAKNTYLDGENSRLKLAQTKPAPPADSDGFIKHRGVLFRRLPSGKIEPTVYCWKCNGPMFALKPFVHFVCSHCKVTAGFKGSWLSEILKEVEGLPAK